MRTQRFCRIMILFMVFPSLKLGIRDFKAKSRRDSGLKVCARGRWDGKNKPWDHGIRGFVGRAHGIEERSWGPSNFTFQLIIDNTVEPR